MHEHEASIPLKQPMEAEATIREAPASCGQCEKRSSWAHPQPCRLESWLVWEGHFGIEALPKAINWVEELRLVLEILAKAVLEPLASCNTQYAKQAHLLLVEVVH